MSKRGRVDFKTKVQILDWLRSERENFELDRPTFVHLTAEINSRFGLSIGSHMVANLCRTAGVSWEIIRKVPVATTKGLAKTCEELSARLEVVEKTLKKLEGHYCFEPTLFGHSSPCHVAIKKEESVRG